MKVLITTDTYMPTVNGVVISLVNLKNYLEERGNEVKILTLSQTTKSYVDGEVTYIASLPANKIYENVRIGLKFSGHSSKYIADIVKWCPDVVHSQSEFSTYIMAKKIAHKVKAPLLHTYHTMYDEYTHYFFPSKRIGKAFVSNMVKSLMKKTSVVIAPTEKVKEKLIEYGVKNEIMVVPTGIDTDKFMSIPDSENWVKNKKSELGIKESQKVLLFVGRIGVEKNIDEIINYLKSYNSPEIVFVIVGGGPHKKELEELVHENNLDSEIIFTGMVSPEQVPLYYKLGDIFVSASTSETQGLTYIEAMSSGLPLLCKKDKCLDGVLEEGINGWFFENEEEFLSKLKLYVHDEEYETEIKKNVIERADKFSARTFAENAEKVYVEAERIYSELIGE